VEDFSIKLKVHDIYSCGNTIARTRRKRSATVKNLKIISIKPESGGIRGQFEMNSERQVAANDCLGEV
jgi:hypothetical protein